MHKKVKFSIKDFFNKFDQIRRKDLCSETFFKMFLTNSKQPTFTCIMNMACMFFLNLCTLSHKQNRTESGSTQTDFWNLFLKNKMLNLKNYVIAFYFNKYPFRSKLRFRKLLTMGVEIEGLNQASNPTVIFTKCTFLFIYCIYLYAYFTWQVSSICIRLTFKLISIFHPFKYSTKVTRNLQRARKKSI